MADRDAARNVGKILEIKGVVVDAVLPDRLQEINTAVRITVPERDGRPAIDSRLLGLDSVAAKAFVELLEVLRVRIGRGLLAA